MAFWKRFTGSVDLSAQAFLKNKKFSREKKTFAWDWHAWNLVLVSTPSLLLGAYLHRVEKRMNEEATVREEIQERTGVSSRGFLIPQRKLREEVQGMLSAGNQRAILAERGEDTAMPPPVTPRTVPEQRRQGPRDGEGSTGNRPGTRDVSEDGAQRKLASQLRSLQRRLDAIENQLCREDDPRSGGAGAKSSKSSELLEDLATRGESDSNEETDGGSTVARGDATDVKPPGAVNAETETAVDKAINMASAAGYWAAKVGARQGKHILQVGQDWLAGDRSEEATQSDNAGISSIGSSSSGVMGGTDDGNSDASGLNGEGVDPRRQEQPSSTPQQNARESINSTKVVAEGPTQVAERAADKRRERVWSSRENLDDIDKSRR